MVWCAKSSKALKMMRTWLGTTTWLPCACSEGILPLLSSAIATPSPCLQALSRRNWPSALLSLMNSRKRERNGPFWKNRPSAVVGSAASPPRAAYRLCW